LIKAYYFANNTLQQNKSNSREQKQGKLADMAGRLTADKAGGLTRQAGCTNIQTFTANIFAAATIRINMNKQGRLADP
jgi:hypothetical protein